MRSCHCIKLCILLAFISFQLQAQQIPGTGLPLQRHEKELLGILAGIGEGTAYTEALLELSSYYLFLPGEEKSDITAALRYAEQAGAESLKQHYIDGLIESLILKGNIYEEDGLRQKALPVLDSAAAILLAAREKGEYRNQPARELRALIQAGKIYRLLYKFELSEKNFQDAVKLAREKRFPVLSSIYFQLSVLEIWKGDWNRSLYYELEAVRSMEAEGDFSGSGIIYFNLAMIYRYAGQFQKAVDYYEMAYYVFKNKPSAIIHTLCARIAEALTKLKRPRDGISQLQDKIRQFPPGTDFEKREIEFSLGTCYRVLSKYDSAEIHFLNYIELQRLDKPADIALAKKLLGQVYVESGNYQKAKPLLDAALGSGVFTGWSLSHLYYMLYKTDSAAGNYLSAIDQLIKNKKIDEVLYRESKTRENQELQIKYESETKDRELKMKEKDIVLLRKISQLQMQNIKQAQLKLKYDSIANEQNIRLLNTESAEKDNRLLLKQQSIDLYTKQDQLRHAKLEQANFQRNVTVAGLILLVIILILLYSRYKVKQQSNQKINEKNISLQRLLEEKEWLLKEVHHRVKNNLHTIMSLLETQSVFLKDDALMAIQSSQHRVYAMSLIHQKLYRTDNSSNVNMAVYLSELIQYLRDSFGVKQRIRFRTDISDFMLDISKAIPLGLILNEAVTNSIKYAFTGDQQGEIRITMANTESRMIRLSVSDNGKGLSLKGDYETGNSLGLKLMKGLSEDLRGSFRIDNFSGTTVNVEFPGDLFAPEPEKEKTPELYS